MASSGLAVLSGIAAAAAGFAGEKVSKDGSVSGLDLGSIVSALLGNKTGGSLLGNLAGAALKSGLLGGGGSLEGLADLAGGLLSVKASASKSAGTGLAGLASAISGGSGKAADLAKIASLASTLIGAVKTDKAKTGLASDLGSALKKSGVSLNLPGAPALKNLDKALPAGDTKTDMFKSILKNLL